MHGRLTFNLLNRLSRDVTKTTKNNIIEILEKFGWILKSETRIDFKYLHFNLWSEIVSPQNAEKFCVGHNASSSYINHHQLPKLWINKTAGIYIFMWPREYSNFPDSSKLRTITTTSLTLLISLSKTGRRWTLVKSGGYISRAQQCPVYRVVVVVQWYQLRTCSWLNFVLFWTLAFTFLMLEVGKFIGVPSLSGSSFLAFCLPMNFLFFWSSEDKFTIYHKEKKIKIQSWMIFLVALNVCFTVVW